MAGAARTPTAAPAWLLAACYGSLILGAELCCLSLVGLYIVASRLEGGAGAQASALASTSLGAWWIKMVDWKPIVMPASLVASVLMMALPGARLQEHFTAGRSAGERDGAKEAESKKKQ